MFYYGSSDVLLTINSTFMNPINLFPKALNINKGKKLRLSFKYEEPNLLHCFSVLCY